MYIDIDKVFKCTLWLLSLNEYVKKIEQQFRTK